MKHFFNKLLFEDNNHIQATSIPVLFVNTLISSKLIDQFNEKYGAEQKINKAQLSEEDRNKVINIIKTLDSSLKDFEPSKLSNSDQQEFYKKSEEYSNDNSNFYYNVFKIWYSLLYNACINKYEEMFKDIKNDTLKDNIIKVILLDKVSNNVLLSKSDYNLYVLLYVILTNHILVDNYNTNIIASLFNAALNYDDDDFNKNLSSNIEKAEKIFDEINKNEKTNKE